MKGPRRLETERLLLRRPIVGDAQAIFERYAGDPVATRYMSWATHRTVADTYGFLTWSEADWELWPAGSYLLWIIQPAAPASDPSVRLSTLESCRPTWRPSAAST